MTRSTGSNTYSLFIPPMVIPPRKSRKTGKMVNQSPWLTLNDRDKWHRRKKLSAHYRAQGFDVAENVALPEMTKAHLIYYLSYGSNRRLDPSNYMLTVKAIVDGMVDYGWLPDDDSKHLDGPDPRRDESLPVGLTFEIVQLA